MTSLETHHLPETGIESQLQALSLIQLNIKVPLSWVLLLIYIQLVQRIRQRQLPPQPTQQNPPVPCPHYDQ